MMTAMATPPLILARTMTFWQLILLICIVGIIIYIVYQLYMRYIRRHNAEIISQKDFEKGMAKAQVIDVRNPEEFQSAHITGARNIPYSSAKESLPGLSKTSPIYLYDNGMNTSGKMARLLRREGYDQIYILQDGFEEWHGKTKRNE